MGKRRRQAADLLNPTSILSYRIDLVLTRGTVSVEDIKLVGDRTSDRTHPACGLIVLGYLQRSELANKAAEAIGFRHHEAWLT